MRLPLSDHAGAASFEVEGARKRMGAESDVKTPMKLWSPRFETKASRSPLGDHTGELLVPRANTRDFAGADPSVGTMLS